MAHDAALDGAPPPLDEWEVADDDEALADAESNEPESEPEPSVPQPLRRRGASPARGRVATSPQTAEGRVHNKYFAMANWLIEKAQVAQDDVSDVLQVLLETYGIVDLEDLRQNGLPKGGSVVRCGPCVVLRARGPHDHLRTMTRPSPALLTLAHSRCSDDPDTPAAELKPLHRLYITAALNEEAAAAAASARSTVFAGHAASAFFAVLLAFTALVAYRKLGEALEDCCGIPQLGALQRAAGWLWAAEYSGELSTLKTTPSTSARSSRHAPSSDPCAGPVIALAFTCVWLVVW